MTTMTMMIMIMIITIIIIIKVPEESSNLVPGVVIFLARIWQDSYRLAGSPPILSAVADFSTFLCA